MKRLPIWMVLTLLVLSGLLLNVALYAVVRNKMLVDGALEAIQVARARTRCASRRRPAPPPGPGRVSGWRA